MSEVIEIRTIRTDGGTQPRAGLDNKTVADYADELKNGAKFPPVVVFFDGSNYWLADGFHRVSAFKFAGKRGIQAEIKQGTLRDAQLYAVGANATHGLRRSRDDKRRAVEMLLSDPEWGQWADREIARRCKVSNTYVSNIRKELGLTVNVDSDNGRKYITKHGTEAVMSVNGDASDSGNVASYGGVDTAVLRRYLEQEYSTKEPAVLAAFARALSTKREHCMQIESRLRLYKPDQGTEGVKVALIALAQELQAYVPSNGNGPAVPNLPALLQLINAIKQLTPQAADQVRQWCDGISVSNDSEAHRPVWEALENLICALRPN